MDDMVAYSLYPEAVTEVVLSIPSVGVHNLSPSHSVGLAVGVRPLTCTPFRLLLGLISFLQYADP